MHDITVAILAQGTHSGRCGNAGLFAFSVFYYYYHHYYYYYYYYYY